MKIELEIWPEAAALLEVLGQNLLGGTGDKKESIELAVMKLVDHAQQGVYRPGAWEREWICQAFGTDFIELLEPGDPYGRPGCEGVFQKPRQSCKT